MSAQYTAIDGYQPVYITPIPLELHGDAPPAFTPYDAEYFLKGSSVVSHDPHLNADGEALYRFLLAHAASRPTAHLHCRGTHLEQRTRTVQRLDASTNTQRTETEVYYESVTDFDFRVDIGQHIVAGPAHWSVPDAEPAYRGLMVREVIEPGGKRNATAEEMQRFKEWEHKRRDAGIPPWVAEGDAAARADTDGDVLLSSHTVRAWADAYCASPKLLKEFSYEKLVTGWNFAALRTAVHALIRQSYAPPNALDVSTDFANTKIRVRADNRLARALSKTWVVVLLWLVLAYPGIWLFKRFHRRGGGRWEVCGGVWAMRHRIPAPADEDDGAPLPLYEPSSSSAAAVVQDGGTAASQLVGLREGEWFRQWEDTIRSAVMQRRKDGQVLKTPYAGRGQVSGAGASLDGYNN